MEVNIDWTKVHEITVKSVMLHLLYLFVGFSLFQGIKNCKFLFFFLDHSFKKVPTAEQSLDKIK